MGEWAQWKATGRMKVGGQVRWDRVHQSGGSRTPGGGHHGTTNKVGTQVGVHVVGWAFNII